jgi:hypothetical protein
MDVKEMGWEAVDWIDLAQDRGSMVGSCENGNEYSGSIKGGNFVTSWPTITFSRRTHKEYQPFQMT